MKAQYTTIKIDQEVLLELMQAKLEWGASSYNEVLRDVFGLEEFKEINLSELQVGDRYEIAYGSESELDKFEKRLQRILWRLKSVGKIFKYSNAGGYFIVHRTE